jgi:hypothetical protein
VFCQTFGLFFARKEISMRDVAILVDGGFYLKRYKKQTDGKQVAKGLLTHCLKHIVFKPSMCSCKSGLIGAFMEFNINSMQFLMF